MRIYKMFRRGQDPVVHVIDTNGPTEPLRHEVYHSPDGFEWGYGGSGPADLARSIVADLARHDATLGEDPSSLSPNYQRVKFALVAALPYQGGEITEAQVREVLSREWLGR